MTPAARDLVLVLSNLPSLTPIFCALLAILFAILWPATMRKLVVGIVLIGGSLVGLALMGMFR